MPYCSALSILMTILQRIWVKNILATIQNEDLSHIDFWWVLAVSEEKNNENFNKLKGNWKYKKWAPLEISSMER